MGIVLCTKKKFRDKTNRSKIYNVGETLEVSDLDRVNDLVSRGICVITAINEEKKREDKSEVVNVSGKDYALLNVKTALEAIGSPVAQNAGVKGVSNAVAKLNEEQVESLVVELEKEK